jgi:hypothetical protein
MTGGRLFLIAMIIASFIAPAARSENCRPTAQIWVNAFSLPAQPSRLADAWRKDTLHADKILIVVRDGADASRPQCALAPLCHQPLKRVRREPSIDHRIPKAEIATGHCRRPFSPPGALSRRIVEDDVAKHSILFILF